MRSLQGRAVPSSPLRRWHSQTSRRTRHTHFALTATEAPVTASGQLNVYAISDLHTDYPENLSWVKQLSGSKYRDAVLLVAGDVSDNPSTLEETLGVLSDKFLHVFFVAGNHELWVKGGPQKNALAADSVQKLAVVQGICSRLGVHTSPKRLGQLWVGPLLSWHHQSWDSEPDVPGVPRASAMTVADYAACVWPGEVDSEQRLGALSIARWADELNVQQPGWGALAEAAAPSAAEPAAPAATASAAPAAAAAFAAGTAVRRAADIITLSHFLPHQQLLPEKRFLHFPNLAKAVGSEPLLLRLLQLRPDLHIFGHSHFAWDAQVQGVRCIQPPLCYPNERRLRLRSVMIGNGWRQEPDAQLPPCDDVTMPDWLPVLVYRASWQAELVPGAAGAGDASCDGAGSVGAAAHAAGIAEEADSSVLLDLLLPGTVSSGDSRSSAGCPEHAAVECSGGQRPQQLFLLKGSDSSIAAGADCPGALPSPAASPASSAGESLQRWQPGSWRLTAWQSETCPELSGMWSDYYKQHQRNAANLELAPWVAKRYRRKAAAASSAS